MKYQIILDTYGGEFCLGTTDKETVDYWSDRTNEELIEHITGDTVRDVPDEYNLYPYFDQSDIIHSNGVILSDYNHIEVLCEDTGETVFDLTLDSFFIRELMVMIDNPVNGLEEGQPIIYSGSNEKGSWIYELEIDTQFDPKKLKFFLHYLEGTFVIDSIEYDEIDCEFVDGTARTINFHASFGEIINTEGDYETLCQTTED